MKKSQWIISLLSILLGIAIFSCSSANKKHIGEWEGVSEGEMVNLVLDESMNAIMSGDGQETLGGDDFYLQDGVKGFCKYEIDYSKNPIWLDIILSDENSNTEVKLLGIIRFLADNKIEYRMSPPFSTDRFDDFDQKGAGVTTFLEKVDN